MRIRPYRALRPTPERASSVASLPYDVVTTAEARTLAAANASSMLRVVRADLEFPDGTDPYSEPVYAQAKANFDRLVAEATLVREATPSVYIYQQQMGAHTQTGLATLCHVDDYDAGSIKKHEKTRPDKENDRTKLTSLLGANPGPVFLTYRDDAAIDELVAGCTASRPALFDFTSPDNIRHTVWQVDEPGALVDAFKAIPCLYVADGHHRAASAARVARERRAGNPNHNGNEDYNWFLSVLFPASQLAILPYNRLVTDLNGRTEEAFLESLSAVGTVQPTDSPTPTQAGDVCFSLGGQWRKVTLTPPTDADPASRLDVSLLQEQVLRPLLGIEDQRTSKRIEFVGGIRGTSRLEEEVRAGRAAVAFSLFPVSIDQLMAIADAGQIMPPKSTWFEPKLRSGLFMHVF